MPVAGWHVGLVHGSIAIPGRTDRDEVVVTTEEIAASGLDYLALGHWHSAQTGKAGRVTYAYSGAPEAVALDQDGAGKVLLVELEEVGTGRSVKVQERQRGPDALRKGDDRHARPLKTQQALIVSLAKRSDPDLVLDVRLNGVRPDELDFDIDEIETALAPGFLKVRVRDVSTPALTEGPLPSPDTIAGAFIRDLEGRIRSFRSVRIDRRSRRGTGCASTRPSPPRRSRGVAVRIRRLHGRDVRRYRTFDIGFRAWSDRRAWTERGRQVDRPARARARASPGARPAPPSSSRRSDRGRAPADARSLIAIDFEQDEEDGQKIGTLEKTFAGSKGHRQARLRRPDDHRPHARRPGDGRADRTPDRRILPGDGLGPSP